MEYNIRLEYSLPLDDNTADLLMGTFEAFHPAPGPSDSDNGNADVWLTIDAKNARQAAELGLALAGRVDSELTAFEVITTADFDRREWNTPLPQLIGSDEAAALLGITRQAIVKKFGHGDLPGRRVGDRTLVFALRDIEAIRDQRAGLPGWVVASVYDGEVSGWFNTQEEAEKHRAGSPSLYVRRPNRGEGEWPDRALTIADANT